MDGLLSAKFLCSRTLSIPLSLVPGAPYGSLFRFFHEKFPRIFTMMTDGPDLSDDKIFILQHS